MTSIDEVVDMIWSYKEDSSMPFLWMDVSFLKRVTKDFLLHGRFCGVLNYDSQRNKIVGCTPLAEGSYTFTPVPLKGCAPIISKLDGTPIDSQFVVSVMRRASPFDLLGTPYSELSTAVTPEQCAVARLNILTPFREKAVAMERMLNT